MDSRAVDPIQHALSGVLSPEAQRLVEEFAPRDPFTEVVYLSTPITTGPKLLSWLGDQRARGREPSMDPTTELVRAEVVDQNMAQLGPIRDAINALWPDSHLVDPTTLEVPGWSQWEYHRFWVETICRYVDRIVFADGWHLSTGCTIEYAVGLTMGLPMMGPDGTAITEEDASRLLHEAGAALEAARRDPSVALAAARRAEAALRNPLKDYRLAQLARSHNVASFCSLAPGEGHVRYQVMPGPRLSRSAGARALIERLLGASRSGSVNVRTFTPTVTKGNPFHYGVRSVDEVLDLVKEAARSNYYCIVNETVDVHDGGVSGVTLGGLAEFAPDDTPRSVEAGDAASLPAALADRLLQLVYGEGVSLPSELGKRIEFSIHPAKVGYRAEQTIVWEIEDVEEVAIEADTRWPNRFSRLIGDKTYGLMVAHAVGVPVPATTAITRRVAPFTFGRPTGTSEWWMRTAPAAQDPGRYTTTRGWHDPFALLAKEDPEGAVAAVLAQEGVAATYSGATLPTVGARGHLIEGTTGVGDDFMLGSGELAELPSDVEEAVRDLVERLEAALRMRVRIEWAADDATVWVLQLHRVDLGDTPAGMLSAGNASVWLSFDPASGLDVLRKLIANAVEIGAGIEVTEPVGITSHVGDLLRKARVPGRFGATQWNL